MMNYIQERAIKISLAATVIALLLASSVGGALAEDHAGVEGECVWCHRSNTTQQFSVQDERRDVCLACHGSGLGANTDVLAGVYFSGRDDLATNANVGAANTPDGAALLGGGFVTFQGAPVTSVHDLPCFACHDPHGSSNYRDLVESINGRAVAVAQVDAGAAKDYDSEQWGAGVNSLCVACHEVDLGMNTGPGGYSHPVGMPYSVGGNSNPETVGYEGRRLPLAQSGDGDLVVCMTCHLPHGSAAQAAKGAGSALLRLDYRGVCQVCHQK